MKKYIYLCLGLSITLSGCNLQQNIIDAINEELKTVKIIEEEAEDGLGTRLNPHKVLRNKQIEVTKYKEYLLGYTIIEFSRGEEANKKMKEFSDNNLKRLTEDEEYVLIKMRMKFIKDLKGKDETYKLSFLNDIDFFNDDFIRYKDRDGSIPQETSRYTAIYPANENTFYISNIIKKNDTKVTMRIDDDLWVTIE